MSRNILTTTNPEETRALGRRAAETLRGGEILGLTGPLGAGKSEFIRGAARAFGIVEPLTSPTFVLSKSYAVSKGRIRHFVHVDAYRLEKPEEVAATEALDFWGRRDSLVFIEWPERLMGVLPKSVEYIRIDRGKGNLRYFTFEKRRRSLLGAGKEPFR